MTRRRSSAGPALALFMVLAAPAAMAHIPQLRGRMIDLVSRSDLIVIATVEDTQRVNARLNATTVRVVTPLVGNTQEARLTFRSQPRFATGRRFVFFLHRAGAEVECIQASGTVLPARPEDDAAYRATVTAIRQALGADETRRETALRAALIPALSATAPPLRYYALLDFASLAHDRLSESERRALERLVADSSTDPAIRPIIATLLQRSS